VAHGHHLLSVQITKSLVSLINQLKMDEQQVEDVIINLLHELVNHKQQEVKLLIVAICETLAMTKRVSVDCCVNKILKIIYYALCANAHDSTKKMSLDILPAGERVN